MHRLLIVDDHAGFRRTARTLLAADGFDVVAEAGDAREALELAMALAPEIVLLDVQLPDVDGFAVARALATSEVAPIVILTSSRDRADYGDLVDESGAHGFVPKAELSGAALRALVG